MKKTAAIFRLTIKSAVRSKLFAGSALLLLLCLGGLPFLIKGDGTTVGEARVLIYYNISIASALIGMLALFESCGAVSQEITERQIQLVRSKPVSCMHIWLGKWLGILCLNALLVCLAGVTTCAALSLRGLTGTDVNREVLTARRRLAPEMVPVTIEADHRYEALKEQGRLPPDANEAAVKEQLKLAIVASRTTVGAGQHRHWEFTVPRGCRPDRLKGCSAVELRSRFNAALRDEKAMLCSWRILSPDGEELFSVEPTTYLDGVNSIYIPKNIVTDHERIVVEFNNLETMDGRTVIFNERRGLEILVSEGGFSANMVRGLIVVFIITALLAALGLTLGSVFSFPVAVFAALSIVASSYIAHFFMTTEVIPHSHKGCAHAHHIEVDTTVGEYIAAGFELVVGRVLRQKPAELISEGLLVSWQDVGNVTVFVFILYPMVLFLAGAYGLSRRQLALPESW